MLKDLNTNPNDSQADQKNTVVFLDFDTTLTSMDEKTLFREYESSEKAMLEAINTAYQSFKSQVLPGVITAIQAMVGQGYEVIINSNNYVSVAEAMLKAEIQKLGMDQNDYATLLEKITIAGINSEAKGKHAKDASCSIYKYSRITKLTNTLKPENCVIIAADHGVRCLQCDPCFNAGRDPTSSRATTKFRFVPVASHLVDWGKWQDMLFVCSQPAFFLDGYTRPQIAASITPTTGTRSQPAFFLDGYTRPQIAAGVTLTTGMGAGVGALIAASCAQGFKIGVIVGIAGGPQGAASGAILGAFVGLASGLLALLVLHCKKCFAQSTEEKHHSAENSKHDSPPSRSHSKSG